MNDLLRALIVRRGTVAADILLDCLVLAKKIKPRFFQANGARLVTLAELRGDWQCRSNMEVIQRMAALQVAELVEATYHSGRNAYWEVHRVGPVV